MKGCFNPSPPFTHPSPSSFLECKRFSCNGLAINEDLLEASMKTSSSHQWRPTFVISRRLRTYTLHRVKGGEGWWRVEQTLHLSQPQCLSGFQAKRWRVKSRVGFLPAKRLSQQTIFQITDGSSEEFFLPTYRFVPGNGTKLPCQRAISCRNQAINERRLLPDRTITPDLPSKSGLLRTGRNQKGFLYR